MYRLVVVSLVILLSGCAATPSVDEAENSNSINTVTMSCSKPYELTQDCSFWSGATRKINIDGFVVKVAASADGKVILVMDTKLFSMPLSEFILLNSPSHSRAANNSFYAIKRVLNQNKIEVVRVRALRSFGNVDGYAVELADDGYTTLKKYSQ